MLRSKTMIAFSLAQPISYLVLFAPFLKTTLATRGADSYAGPIRSAATAADSPTNGSPAPAAACAPTPYTPS